MLISGLSEGLHKAGVTETLWAIEKDKLAGRTFYVNNAQATVFTDDCNVFLKDVMDEVIVYLQTA